MDSEVSRITKLKGPENWSTWKFQVRVTLKSKETWDIVDGTLPLPASYQSAIAQWTKKDSIAQHIIATTVDENPLIHVMNCESSKEIWDKLRAVYEQKSEASVHLLMQQWYASQKNPEDDIATHVARLEDLAHRLQLVGEKISDQMIITKILLTLPPPYKYFVSAWESTPAAERTLNNLVSRLTIEESRSHAAKKPENTVLATQRPTTANKKPPGTCHYCHKPDTGYAIVGKGKRLTRGQTNRAIHEGKDSLEK